jgi:hypothetical protein
MRCAKRLELVTWTVGFSAAPLFTAAADSSLIADPSDAVQMLTASEDGKTMKSASSSIITELITGASPELLQQELCDAIRTASNPQQLRRLTRILAVRPCDEAFEVLLQRLDASTGQDETLAICEGLMHLAGNTAPIGPSLRSDLAAALEPLIRDTTGTQPCIADAAVLALGSLGGIGYEELTTMASSPNVPERLFNVYYTALGLSGDPRAADPLCAHLLDPRARVGSRIQAASALRFLYHACQRSGNRLGVDRLALCISAVQSCLSEPTPPELRGVAIQTLAQFIHLPNDVDVWETVLSALRAPNSELRRAAMEALFWVDCDALDEEARELIQNAAEHDPAASVRSSARDLLERFETSPAGA